MNNKQVIANLRKHGIMAFQRFNQDFITVVHQSEEGAMLAELDIDHNGWCLSAENGFELCYLERQFEDGDHKSIRSALSEHYFYGDD